MGRDDKSVMRDGKEWTQQPPCRISASQERVELVKSLSLLHFFPIHEVVI